MYHISLENHSHSNTPLESSCLEDPSTRKEDNDAENEEIDKLDNGTNLIFYWLGIKLKAKTHTRF